MQFVKVCYFDITDRQYSFTLIILFDLIGRVLPKAGRGLRRIQAEIDGIMAISFVNAFYLLFTAFRLAYIT